MTTRATCIMERLGIHSRTDVGFHRCSAMPIYPDNLQTGEELGNRTDTGGEESLQERTHDTIIQKGHRLKDRRNAWTIGLNFHTV